MVHKAPVYHCKGAQGCLRKPIQTHRQTDCTCTLGHARVFVLMGADGWHGSILGDGMDLWRVEVVNSTHSCSISLQNNTFFIKGETHNNCCSHAKRSLLLVWKPKQHTWLQKTLLWNNTFFIKGETHNNCCSHTKRSLLLVQNEQTCSLQITDSVYYMYSSFQSHPSSIQVPSKFHHSSITVLFKFHL